MRHASVSMTLFQDSTKMHYCIFLDEVLMRRLIVSEEDPHQFRSTAMFREQCEFLLLRNFICYLGPTPIWCAIIIRISQLLFPLQA
jgi:hypothetical protein